MGQTSMRVFNLSAQAKGRSVELSIVLARYTPISPQWIHAFLGFGYSRRPRQWDRGASASPPRFGISMIIGILSLLTLAIANIVH
jgi:hypothetical protein